MSCLPPPVSTAVLLSKAAHGNEVSLQVTFTCLYITPSPGCVHTHKHTCTHTNVCMVTGGVLLCMYLSIGVWRIVDGTVVTICATPDCRCQCDGCSE